MPGHTPEARLRWLTGGMSRRAGHRAEGAFRARPLTPATWPDLEELFGLPGGSIVRGCWCMYYRKTGKESGLAGSRNKRALCELVSSGGVPGLVGYLDGSPVGWISLGLLEAAMDFARDRGVRMLEAYPVDKTERSHDEFMFFGSRSLYERAGFREVVRRSPTRVVMRRALRPRRGTSRGPGMPPFARPNEGD